MATELLKNGQMPVTGGTSSLPARLLNKGPEYLRKHMEVESRGKVSAVERLAADKAKFVKGQQLQQQQMIISKQGAVVACSSDSETSSESYPAHANLKSTEETMVATDPPTSTDNSSTIVRRSSSKKQRPDSLVMYRQKCELVKGSSSDSSKGSLVRRLFHGTLKDNKQVASPEVRPSKNVRVEHAVHQQSAKGKAVATTPNQPSPCKASNQEVTETVVQSEAPKRGLFRSHSDISSRYSKAFSEFESFFKYCGLDSDVIDDLGKENFSAVSDNVSFRLRSVSVVTSNSGFTKHSGDSDGLLEEELNVKTTASTGTSAVERNARVIKWLYGCRNAREAGRALRELV
ncbi:protein FAM110C [Polypterus senegalus]|nr:protein FAM110C [Polypterus senegalus]